MMDLVEWRNSPLVEATAQVLETIIPGQVSKRRPDRERLILVTSYKEDFEYLWTCGSDLSEWLAQGDRHVIVVWDGDLDPGKLAQYDVSEYLTPADWSVMITLAVDTGEVPQITVLDFSSYRHQASHSLQRFRQLLRMNPSPLPHIREINPMELKEFFSGLAAHAPKVPPKVPPTEEDCSMVRALWSSLLSEAKGAHHAIANIAGPLLLLESMQHPNASTEPALPGALRQLVRAVQMPGQKSTTEVDPSPDGEPWFDFKKELGQSVDSIVLIDDLAENGWGEVLRGMLGLGAADPTLRTYLRPFIKGSTTDKGAIDLCGYLRNRLNWLRSDRRAASPSLAPNVRNPLVFLDIRLFSQSSIQKEREFYRSLLLLAAEFAALPALAWPVDLSETTLDPVKRFVDADSEIESPDHHAALSLLPRLLSLADPTVPIILFSSTGRRAIVEPLIPCGNIIFDFEKPRLLGSDWREAVDRSRVGIKHAMQRACPLLQTRAFLQELCQKASRGKLVPDKNPAATQFQYADIYFDESGDDRFEGGASAFSVGGVVVFYRNAQARDQLDQALKENELTWGLAENHPPFDPNDSIPERYIPKYPGGMRWNPGAYKDYLDRLDECLTKLDIELAGFALVWRPALLQTPSSLPEPLREEVIDNRYRRMIEEALEAVLYCIVPAYLTEAQITVDCGTREKPPLPPYGAKRLRYDFGIGINRRTGNYYVLSPDAVYPIVGRLLAQRHGAPPNVQRTRGTTLYEYQHLVNIAQENPDRYRRIVNDRSRPRPRQIHFLADWFARFGMHYPSLPSAKIVTRAFRNGFLDYRDRTFSGWLRASRAGAEGRITDALSEVWTVTRESAPAWSAARWLSKTVAAWTELLDGPAFIELATRIHSNSVQNSEASPEQKIEALVQETERASTDNHESAHTKMPHLFKRLVPGAGSGEVKLKRVAIEGNGATIAVAGAQAVKRTIGEKGAVIKRLRGELKQFGIDKLEVIEWSDNPIVLTARALKDKGKWFSIAKNQEGGVELRPPDWIQVTPEEIRLVSALVGNEITVVVAAKSRTK